ncbi:hypothetical protein [Glycomyces tarimensis]
MWILNRPRRSFTLRYLFLQVITVVPSVALWGIVLGYVWAGLAVVVFATAAPRALAFWPVARLTPEALILIPQYWGRPITVAWKDIEGIDLIEHAQVTAAGRTRWIHVAVRRRQASLTAADRERQARLFGKQLRRAGRGLRKSAVGTVGWYAMLDEQRFAAQLDEFGLRLPVRYIPEHRR